MIKNKNAQIYEMSKASKEYEKIFDTFPV